MYEDIFGLITKTSHTDTVWEVLVIYSMDLSFQVFYRRRIIFKNHPNSRADF